MKMHWLFRSMLIITPMIIFILLWHVATDWQPERQFIYSSPKAVAHTFIVLLKNGQLLTHTFTTLFETIAGFAIGVSLGTVLGLSLWYSPLLSMVARPYIIGLAAIPVFALAPVMIVWFGIGLISKIMMAALSTIGVAMMQSFQGAHSVETRHLKYMEVLGASRWQTFYYVIIPSAAVWVINAMKLNVSLALMGAFIGEFISAEKGLGYLIVKSSGVFDMASVFVGCLVLTTIALILSALTSWLERHILHWQ